MAKTNITQYDSTPSNNADINSINIAENCPASNINNAIRELMAHLKNMDTGSQALTSPSFTAMSTDTINEKTSTNGVAIDSVTLKDGELGTTASPVPINSSSLNGGQFGGKRNMIINGEMTISQRYSTTSTAVTNASLFVLDRFRVNTTAGGGTSLNVQQVYGNPTNAPIGHPTSMKMTVATVDDGGSDSFNVVQTRIESFNTDYLAFGTSSAKTVTLSFQVKSSLTGTFGGSLVSGDFSRGYAFQYTINSADTWEKKTITIVGDTTSTADSVYNRGSTTSAIGLVLYFDLGSGSDFEKSSANSWSTDGNGYGARISGNVKLCANNGADWSITGIQLEEGSTATPFEHRSFGEELSLCQRFFAKEDGVKMRNFTGTTIAVSIPHFWKTTMRVAPTITGTNASVNETINTQGFSAYKTSIASGGQWQLTGTKADAEL
jgi:hypothetical protein